MEFASKLHRELAQRPQPLASPFTTARNGTCSKIIFEECQTSPAKEEHTHQDLLKYWKNHVAEAEACYLPTLNDGSSTKT